MIIGPPGVGKTTALRSSGLPFPHAKGGRVRGVGGTRNCDWWLTNDAVILDTAGRWATQEDDREEWLAFLDLLRKTRPRKPVNGILVAVSVTDLQGDADEIAALAKSLRERIDEVMGRLDMVLPVYLLFTKCDLVPGFVEMFGDLRDKERGQIWGFTLPLAANGDERIEMFSGHFDELCEVIEQKAAERVHDERRVRGSLLDCRVPAPVRNPAAAPDRSGDRSLRGERVPGRPHHARGLLHQRHPGGPAHRPDHEVDGRGFRRPGAGRSRGGQQAQELLSARPLHRGGLCRQRRRHPQYPGTGATANQAVGPHCLRLAGAAGFLFLPIRSYRNSQNFIHEARRFVDKLATGRQGQQTAPLPVAETLESVESMAKTMVEDSEASVLFPRSATNQSLRATIERLVVRPILRADMAKASGLAPAELMDALVLHLLLTAGQTTRRTHAAHRGLERRRPSAQGRKRRHAGRV